jgi:ubiquitin C-terminal hydrolase
MEMFRHLSLGVEGDPGHDGPISIQKSLESFFKPEEVEIKCEKCETGKTALQTMKLVNRPKALLLHLKRFVVEHRKKENGEFETVCRKNKASVTLNVTVSVDKVTDMKVGAGRYSLCGFVRHQGVSAASGHYTAAAVRSRPLSEGDKGNEGPAQEVVQEWVSFDDVRTAITSLRSETSNLDNQRNAYLCLYALK